MSGKTVQRSIYVPTPVFQLIERVAQSREEKVAKVIIQLLTERVHQIEEMDGGEPQVGDAQRSTGSTECTEASEDRLEEMIAHCQFLLMQVIDATMPEHEANAAIAQAKADLEVHYPTSP
ncbi:MAG: hypothetical protein AAFN79_11915 [Pseudomonadota bacterium]